jgi:hypothetical protein
MVNRYDDAVRALCAVDLTGLCGWLGAKASRPPDLLRLSESAPPTSTRQLDLLVGVDDDLVLHVEFQTRPERRFAQRMLGLRRALALVADFDDPDHRHDLARATVELAHVRLDAATINRTWEESAMPIPSLLNKLYLEGEANGRAEERAAMLTSLLHRRFGDDPGIPAVAGRLGALENDEAFARIDAAASLDELQT